MGHCLRKQESRFVWVFTFWTAAFAAGTPITQLPFGPPSSPGAEEADCFIRLKCYLFSQTAWDLLYRLHGNPTRRSFSARAGCVVACEPPLLALHPCRPSTYCGPDIAAQLALSAPFGGATSSEIFASSGVCLAKGMKQGFPRKQTTRSGERLSGMVPYSAKGAKNKEHFSRMKPLAFPRQRRHFCCHCRESGSPERKRSPYCLDGTSLDCGFRRKDTGGDTGRQVRFMDLRKW
jgi:hypothetical protein